MVSYISDDDDDDYDDDSDDDDNEGSIDDKNGKELKENDSQVVHFDVRSWSLHCHGAHECRV